MSLQCPGTHRIGTSSKSNTTGCDPTRHFVEISYVLAWKRPFNITVGLFVVVSLLRARDSGSKGNSADARYTKKSLAHHCISRGPYSYTRISSSADYRDLLNYMISMPEKHSYPTKRDIMLLLWFLGSGKKQHRQPGPSVASEDFSQHPPPKAVILCKEKEFILWGSLCWFSINFHSKGLSLLPSCWLSPNLFHVLCGKREKWIHCLSEHVCDFWCHSSKKEKKGFF